jgi:hypothetical protein
MRDTLTLFPGRMKVCTRTDKVLKIHLATVRLPQKSSIAVNQANCAVSTENSVSIHDPVVLEYTHQRPEHDGF